jgi:hypothetical protein
MIMFLDLDYQFEQYHSWKENENIFFQRKLENETAFDGIVKIYSLKASSEPLNELLQDKFFGDFFYATPQGIFLRLFEKKDSWPRTTVVFVDFEKITLVKILKTKSSWHIWTGTALGNNRHSINISPTESVEFEVR